MTGSVGEPVNLAVYKSMGIDLDGPVPRDILAASVFIQITIYRKMMGAASSLERQGEAEQEKLRKLIDTRSQLANVVAKLDEADSKIDDLDMHVRDRMDRMFAINRSMEQLGLAGPSANPRIFDAGSNGWAPDQDGVTREGLYLLAMHEGWEVEVWDKPDVRQALRDKFNDDAAMWMGETIKQTILKSPGEQQNPVKDLDGKQVMDLIFGPDTVGRPTRQLQARTAFVNNYYNIENACNKNPHLRMIWGAHVSPVGGHLGDQYFDQALRANCHQISGGIHGGTTKAELQAAVDALNSEINLRSTNNGQTLEKTSVAFSQASSCIESALQSMLKLFAAFNAAGTRM